MECLRYALLLRGFFIRHTPYIQNYPGDHSFSKYAKFSGKINISHPLIRTRACAYQGVKNVSFF